MVKQIEEQKAENVERTGQHLVGIRNPEKYFLDKSYFGARLQIARTLAQNRRTVTPQLRLQNNDDDSSHISDTMTKRSTHNNANTQMPNNACNTYTECPEQSGN